MSHFNAQRRAQQSSLLPSGISQGCQNRVQETAGLHRDGFLPALEAQSGPACLQARAGSSAEASAPGLLTRGFLGCGGARGEFSPALVVSVSRVSLFIKIPVDWIRPTLMTSA